MYNILIKTGLTKFQINHFFPDIINQCYVSVRDNDSGSSVEVITQTMDNFDDARDFIRSVCGTGYFTYAERENIMIEWYTCGYFAAKANLGCITLQNVCNANLVNNVLYTLLNINRTWIEYENKDYVTVEYYTIPNCRKPCVHAGEDVELYDIWGFSLPLEILHNNLPKRTMAEFLELCDSSEREIDAVLLSGVQKLWAEVREYLPEDLGPYKFRAINILLQILNVSK